MKRVGIVYLIAEIPEAAGVMDERTETRRKTFCEEKSVSMSEIYQAGATGPDEMIRLKLPQGFEYRRETICEYKGERYRIVRPYGDEKTEPAMELTLKRIRGNAAKPEPEPDPEEPTQGGSEGSDSPVGNSPEGESDPNESTETSGEAATIEGADSAVTGDTTESDPAAEGGDGDV